MTAKPAGYEIKIFEVKEAIPDDAVVLGEITIGDSGLTFKCDYTTVLELAKEKARQAGGDAIKIVSRKRPDILSSCYRIKAQIIAFDGSN